MKIVNLWVLALLLLTGCSTERETDRDFAEEPAILAYRGGGSTPGNNDNPYDYVGQVFHEMAYSYHNDTIKPSSISGIIAQVEAIGNLDSGFTALKSHSYSAPSALAVGNIQTYGVALLPGVLAGSGLSTTGRSSMTLLVELIIDQSENADPFEDSYDAIADFEDAVLAHSGLTAYDKKVLLIVSSVGRHSVSLVKKKPKKNTDPDWTVLIINIVGTVEGALKSEAEAISTGLVCGILENL